MTPAFLTNPPTTSSSVANHAPSSGRWTAIGYCLLVVGALALYVGLSAATSVSTGLAGEVVNLELLFIKGATLAFAFASLSTGTICLGVAAIIRTVVASAYRTDRLPASAVSGVTHEGLMSNVGGDLSDDVNSIERHASDGDQSGVAALKAFGITIVAVAVIAIVAVS